MLGRLGVPSLYILGEERGRSEISVLYSIVKEPPLVYMFRIAFDHLAIPGTKSNAFVRAIKKPEMELVGCPEPSRLILAEEGGVLKYPCHWI
jgi:hypothetical protein